MMKRLPVIMMLLAAVVMTTGCEIDFFTTLQNDIRTYNDSNGGGGGVAVAFQSALQVGGVSGTTDTTSLTLTFDVDPGPLTAGNISITGATPVTLSGTGTTRNVTIAGITVANGATVSVSIASPAGYSISGSPKTAEVFRLLTIGMDYLGGKIAYILQSGDPGYNASVPHGLIAATADQGAGIVWISGGATQTTSVPGGTGTAIGTGSANTDNIIAQAIAAGNTTLTSYAAGLARAHNGGGFNDWYLPSKNELSKLWVNKATVGGFFNDYYWSSSQSSAGLAETQNFDTGLQTTGSKSGGNRVRAVRSF